MSDTIITVENLSKRYHLGTIGATSLRESSERAWHKVRGRSNLPAACLHRLAKQCGQVSVRLRDCRRAGNSIWQNMVNDSMTDLELKFILSEGEGQFVEFKETVGYTFGQRPSPHPAAREVWRDQKTRDH